MAKPVEYLRSDEEISSSGRLREMKATQGYSEERFGAFGVACGSSSTHRWDTKKEGKEGPLTFRATLQAVPLDLCRS